jgi:hypothetical protein
MVGRKIVEEPYIQARNSKLEIERNQSLEERLLFGDFPETRRDSTSSTISSLDGSISSDLNVTPSSSPVDTRLTRKSSGTLNLFSDDEKRAQDEPPTSPTSGSSTPVRKRSYTTISKAKGLGSLRYVKKEDEQKGWSLQKGLQDGVVLCELMRRICPDSIPSIHMDARLPFKVKENICIFIAVSL